uniref:DNA-directed DNA polymerase n=1 Tax=Panagrolaimus sp. ES5 TaxID=591445 RepID=A0AC34F2L9_9BILA
MNINQFPDLILPAKPKRKAAKPAALTYGPMENGATLQMILNPNEYEYTPFNFDLNAIYFVNKRQKSGKTELVKYVGGNKVNVNENFPKATFCYRNIEESQYVPKNEIYYDMFCPYLFSSILVLPDGKKISAIYVRDLIPRQSNGVYRLYGKYENFHEVDQSVKPCTMEELIRKKIKNGKVSCWIVVDQEEHGWKVLPSLSEPPPQKSFVSLWKKMNSYSYGEDTYDFFGIVVFPGKLLIERILVECPKEFKLGSTYMCRIQDTAMSTTAKTHFLTKCEPFTIDSELIKIHVDDDGKVMIKTVVGAMGIPKLKINWINQYANENGIINEGIDKFKDRVARYNVVVHPFFGKIILPRTLVWSTDATQIIFTFLFAASHELCSLGRAVPFALAVHDGFNMVRLPIHLKTTLPAIKLLIDHGIKLKKGVTDVREKEVQRLPMLPLKGYEIAGPVFSTKYTLPYEIPYKEPEPLYRLLKEDTHVLLHNEQIRPRPG